MARYPHRSPSTGSRRARRLCGSSRRGFPPCDGAVAVESAHPRSVGMDTLSPAPKHRCTCVEPSKAEVGAGASAVVRKMRKSFLGATATSCSDLSSEPCGEPRDRRNGADYVSGTHAPGDRAKRNHLQNPRNFANGRRQRPRVDGAQHSPSGLQLASGPRQIKVKVAADMLGLSGSNRTARRRRTMLVVERMDSESPERLGRLLGVISTRLRG